MGEDEIGVPSRLLNKLFVEKAAKGGESVSRLSETFIFDRLRDITKSEPEVSCTFRRDAENLRWRFHIKLYDGKVDTIVGIEVTEKELMAYEMPVTYYLEKHVREELGLTGF